MADTPTTGPADGSAPGDGNGKPNNPAGAAGGAGGAPPIDRIEDLQIEQELQDSYLTYAMSTIMDRALPDVRDGLKPSQRRILVAMRDLNLSPRSKHLKCAKIAGNTSGDYHPHGEAVVYPTLVRLGQDWVMRYPLIDPQGNFGSSDGDPPAAMRYTEARPTAPEAEMLQDLELDTVDYQPNYDDRLTEPTVLPSKFPNLLVNGSTGIAVGMACNLLPHNLREICDAIVKVIDKPDVTLPELLEIVPGPDFPTGGTICGRDGIVEGYKSGRGRVTLRAKMHVEEPKSGRGPTLIIEACFHEPTETGRRPSPRRWDGARGIDAIVHLVRRARERSLPPERHGVRASGDSVPGLRSDLVALAQSRRRQRRLLAVARAVGRSLRALCAKLGEAARRRRHGRAGVHPHLPRHDRGNS